MADHLSKLLFPRAARDERRRQMRTLWLLLVAGLLGAALMAGLLYIVYNREGM